MEMLDRCATKAAREKVKEQILTKEEPRIEAYQETVDYVVRACLGNAKAHLTKALELSEIKPENYKPDIFMKQFAGSTVDDVMNSLMKQIR